MKVKISSSQAVILLLICRIYHTVYFSPLTSADMDTTAILLGNLIAILLTPVFLIPLFLFYRKEGEGQGDLLDTCYRIAAPLGVLAVLFYLLLFLKDLIETVGHFESFITNVAFPETSSTVIIVTFLLACSYGASMGLEGIARSVSIIFVIFSVNVLIVILSGRNYVNWVNFTPYHSDMLPDILEIIEESLFKNIEFALLLVLYTKIKGKFWKISVSYLGLSAVFILLVGGTVILVLGDFTSKQVFPFYTVSAIVENSVIQRMDSFHMAIWVLVSFSRVSLYLNVSGDLLKRLLPQKRAGLALPFVTGITFLGILADNFFHSQSTHFTELISMAWPVLIAVVIIPVIALLGRRKTA